MKTSHLILLGLCLPCGLVAAETPQQVLATYVSEAGKGFSPSAQRGEAFFRKRFAQSEKMPACTSCHTDNPKNTGQHAVTGKSIKPMAPVANAQRLTDMGKVEKWFKRNCQEVVARPCSAQEKADFVLFLSSVK